MPAGGTLTDAATSTGRSIPQALLLRADEVIQ
jgi:hypothetical protein